MDHQISTDTSPNVRTRSTRAATLDHAAAWWNDVSDKITNKLTSRLTNCKKSKNIRLIFDNINTYIQNIQNTASNTNNDNFVIHGTSIYSPHTTNNVSGNLSPNQQLDIPAQCSRRSSTDNTSHSNTILSSLTINTSVSNSNTRRNSTDTITSNDTIHSTGNDVLNSIKGGMNGLITSFKSLNSTRHASRRNSNDSNTLQLRHTSIATVNEYNTNYDTIDNMDLKEYYSAEVKESSPTIHIESNSAISLLSPTTGTLYGHINNFSPHTFNYATPQSMTQLHSISVELENIVNIMYGDLETKLVDKELAAECCDELCNESDLLLYLICSIEQLEFESRKNLCKIVEYMMNEYHDKTVQYIVFRSEILHKLVDIYDYHPSVISNTQSQLLSCRSDSTVDTINNNNKPNNIVQSFIQQHSSSNTNSSTNTTPVLTSTATMTTTPTLSSMPALSAPSSTTRFDTQLILCCDLILRSLLSDRDITAKFLNAEPSLLTRYFHYSQLPVFELSSHAFDTLRLILLQYSELGYYYIIHHYTEFIELYNQLLQLHDNYYIKYQACKLLYDIISQSHEIQLLYCTDSNNLRITMINLKGNKQIQKQVYYILHVFICNYNAQSNIQRILYNNKDNFIKFLEQFECDTDDTRLIQSKVQMVEALQLIDTNVGTTVQQ